MIGYEPIEEPCCLNDVGMEGGGFGSRGVNLDGWQRGTHAAMPQWQTKNGRFWALT